MLFIGSFNVRTGFKESMKDKILDEVCCCKLRSTCIQCFEYLLGVFVCTQINYNHLKEISYNCLNSRGTTFHMLSTFDQ